MLTKIEDETGQTWWVAKGDPAHESVQKLHTRYYTWIVLPRQLIRSGILAAIWDWPKALRQARHLEYNVDRGKRHLRLAECLKALED